RLLYRRGFRCRLGRRHGGRRRRRRRLGGGFRSEIGDVHADLRDGEMVRGDLLTLVHRHRDIEGVVVLAGGQTHRYGGHRVTAPTPGDPLEIVTGPHGAFGDTLTAGHGLEQRVGDVIEPMLGENAADVGLV